MRVGDRSEEDGTQERDGCKKGMRLCSTTEFTHRKSHPKPRYDFVDVNDSRHAMRICAASRRREDVCGGVGVGKKLSMPGPCSFPSTTFQHPMGNAPSTNPDHTSEM